MKLLKNALAALAVLGLAAGPALAADNLAVTPGTGATVAAKDVAGVLVPRHTNVDESNVYVPLATSAQVGEVQASPTANTVLDRLKTIGTNTTGAATAANQSTANTSLSNIDGKLILPVAGVATTTITHPSNGTLYTANDAYADTTPTSGGFTLSSVCSAAGKSGVIVSLAVIDSVDQSTLLQGELWLFDSSVTEITDNAAFALSDTDSLKLVSVVPFTLATTVGGSGTNSIYTANGLSLAYTCSGSANLRFLVKVKNGYTPVSGETLTFRANYIQSN